jgi:biofilm PGA synthesis N-glycosyltransferase PgaC
MEISVGVICHNEGGNIGKLLESILDQESAIRIVEIMVVSSGSSDSTDEIVEAFSRKDRRIMLIKEPERLGKSSAINLFLSGSKSENVVLISGDVGLEAGVIQKLCSALSRGAGISVGRPVPEEGNGILRDIVKFQWDIHHKISVKKPKFGEVIAFKKVFDAIDETSVDEECIGMLVKKAGLGSEYVPDAIIKNRGPRKLKDFVKQRRRIYGGHLALKRRSNHSPLSMDNLAVLKTAASVNASPRVFAASLLLEGLSRILGLLDFMMRKEHVIWDMVAR